MPCFGLVMPNVVVDVTTGFKGSVQNVRDGHLLFFTLPLPPVTLLSRAPQNPSPATVKLKTHEFI